jgi:hypothetical protein
MSAIYIVNGFTGVYDDREIWIEGAYQTHEEAMGRVDQLNNILIAHGCYDAVLVDGLDCDRCTELGDAMRGEDALFRCDYNGAHYSYERVELKKWMA